MRSSNCDQTVVELIERHSSGPSLTVVADPGGTQEQISRDELLSRARAIAAQLQAMGVGPGDRVLSIATTTPAFIAALFGVWYARAVIVPTAPPPRRGRERYLARLESIVQIANPGVVLGTPSFLADVAACIDGDAPPHMLAFEQLATTETELEGVAPMADDVALLQFTSGSTGVTRAAVIRHGQIVQNALSSGRRRSVSHEDRLLSWLPLYHDFGLIGGLLWPFVWDCPADLIPTEFVVRNPVLWLKSISKHRSTLSPAPPFALQLVAQHVNERKLSSIDLSSWRYAIVGAEQIFLHVLEAFQRKLEPHGLSETTLHPGYGLAEATLAVTHTTADTTFHAEWIDRDVLREQGTAMAADPNGQRTIPVVSNGPPIDDTLIRIVDDRGHPLADRQQGNVQVQGPSVTEGYYRAESPVIDDWLDTGDLGFVVAGELYITGRKKDLLIRGGIKVHANEIESVVQSIPGIRRVAAIAMPDHDAGKEDVVLLAEERGLTEPEKRQAAETIRRAIMERAGLQIDRVVLVPIYTIPRTTSGKIQRSSCLPLVQQGEEY